MRIFFSDNHIYPLDRSVGAGKSAIHYSSGSSKHVHDLIVKALGEKGHTVFYHVKSAPGVIPPKGVHFVDHLIDDVDIVHLPSHTNMDVADYYKAKNIPLLATNHLYRPNEIPPFKWVNVSKTIAELYNNTEYVWCGLNPDDYVFSSRKKDYFLFMADVRKHYAKGLDIALKLSKKFNFKLVVAGSSREQKDIDKVQELCDHNGATYLGGVRGIKKAQLISEAKAFISPSRLIETFGLTLVEALFSGTPVICSSNGAYSEIMTSDVSFVCDEEADYHHAIKNIDKIDPFVCREYAINNFHYLKTTDKYVEIYKSMISKSLAHG